MSTRKLRMEVRQMLDSLQAQIVATSNHLQFLTVQYTEMCELLERLQVENVNRVGKLVEKSCTPEENL